MAAEAKPQEIFMENIQLKEENENLRRFKERVEKNSGIADESRITDEREYWLRSFLHDSDTRVLIDRTPTCNKFCTQFVIRTLLKVLLIVLVTVCVITVYVLTERRHDSTLKSLVSAVKSSTKEPKAVYGGVLPFVANKAGNTDTDAIQKNYLNIGLRQDYQIQECQGSELKQSFPDVDYSLLGYNILKGFPLATGHDPGFTYPIFRHDYSSGGMTADCRYSVPRGLVIIPDVSCVTSFSSTTIQTKYEFSKALSTSASVSGGGWGVSFSASAGYKQSSSEMSTGESVYIVSSAHCNYYFSKLITEEAPQFDNVFVNWIHKMNETDWDPELYFEFFETYGTHFPTEVTFGARFVYEHKMSSSKYESEKKSGVNVAVQASYSGLFSVGGGFSLDSEQRQAASSFSKSVETKTITVGAAPPSNGDAMTWASEVKTSPVPTAYKLSSIELLFTERYMGKMNVDYERIRHNIDTKKHEYCLYLQKQGEVESCDSLVAGVELGKTRLFHHYKEMQVALSTECIEKCLEEVECVAVTVCITCKSDNFAHNTCYMYKESGNMVTADRTEAENAIWQSNIFPEKMKNQIEFSDAAIVGVPRGFENDQDKTSDQSKCHELCIKDAHCVAYTHCHCPDKIVKCNMYSKERTSGLIKQPGTKAFFISSRQRVKTTTPVSTKVGTTTTTTTKAITTNAP
ncbi:uncharacterized protein LOC123547063 [Mercenaria mercenaria]|uniref:uncharacterized protein LOC123547063 n=1 Tax=Mercenaria mercenaria TaxID=6596 RepID=UPI00234F4583|nr:uncharacterized protein LOC123547063 [Mercenaria mercenaria]